MEDLLSVTNCVTVCYMRAVLNISLPQNLAEIVREEVKDKNYASVSEFMRELVREWHENRILAELKKSEADMRSGKGILLKSIRDLR